LKGVPIIGVMPGSLAEAAGLRKGDFLLSVNGQEVENIGDFLDARRTANGVLNITVFRDGEISNVVFRLDLNSRPPLGAAEIAALAMQLPRVLSDKAPTLH
jgi:S1-C subfamily serine protease